MAWTFTFRIIYDRQKIAEEVTIYLVESEEKEKAGKSEKFSPNWTWTDFQVFKVIKGFPISDSLI
jgi:hypothetical protein